MLTFELPVVASSCTSQDQSSTLRYVNLVPRVRLLKNDRKVTIRDQLHIYAETCKHCTSFDVESIWLLKINTHVRGKISFFSPSVLETTKKLSDFEKALNLRPG